MEIMVAQSKPGKVRGPILGKYGLTDREIEVLEYVATGMNNGEIAKLLGLTESAVFCRIDTAMKRFGCRTKAQLVFELTKKGILK